MDKAEVIAALRSQVREELDGVERTTRMALDEATSAESRPENKYDTRSLEASYLAAGQGERLVSLRRLVSFLELAEVAPTRGVAGQLSLVEIDGDSVSSWFLIAPDGGGRRVHTSRGDVVVVTPDSPLGAALVGCQKGDQVPVGKSLTLREVLAIE